MTRNVPAWVLLLCAGWGCVRQGASPAPAAPQAPHGWEMMPTTHLRVQLQPLGRVPNSGLQLPAVSPDGEWVAYLQVAPDQEVQPEGLFSGKGPFVAYQDSGRCELCIHNLTTGKTRRTAVGLKHLLAPVFSPSGCYLAVAGSNLPDQSQLHIFDPSTAELQAGPPAKGAHQQLWPHWVDDRTLVYLAHEDDGSFLCRWTRGSGVPPERLCQVNTSSSALGSSQVFAGLAGPLSPGGRRPYAD